MYSHTYERIKFVWLSFYCLFSFFSDWIIGHATLTVSSRVERNSLQSYHKTALVIFPGGLYVLCSVIYIQNVALYRECAVPRTNTTKGANERERWRMKIPWENTDVKFVRERSRGARWAPRYSFSLFLSRCCRRRESHATSTLASHH